MRYTLGNKGFSLPEIIVALGLMGGISLVTMKLVEDQKNNEAYIKGRAEINKAVSLVKNSLNNPENCRSILAGNTLVYDPGVSLTELRVPLSTPGQSRVILRQNTNYNSFRTSGIRVVRTTDNADDLTATANIEVDFRMKSINSKLWGPDATINASDKIITERIPINVSLNDAGTTITDCGVVVSRTNEIARQKFCESLGGAARWDDPDGPGGTAGTCTFEDRRCDHGEVLVRLTSLGGVICEPIQQHINLNELFDERSCTNTGTYQIVDDGGKLRIECL